MCCLKYEHPLYADFAREVPAVGERVSLDEGEAVVVAHQVPADSVRGPDERHRGRDQLLARERCAGPADLRARGPLLPKKSASKSRRSPGRDETRAGLLVAGVGACASSALPGGAAACDAATRADRHVSCVGERRARLRTAHRVPRRHSARRPADAARSPTCGRRIHRSAARAGLRYDSNR